MRQILGPALTYAALIFAAGFVLGALRILVLVPRLGAVTAVALEVPIMLGLSWLVAGRILRHRPLPGLPRRFAMGALAFVLLTTAETGLGIVLFGRTFADSLADMTTLLGLIGLTGQIGFGLVPALRGQPRG